MNNFLLRIIDIALALLLILFLLPIILALMIIVILFIGYPPFYISRRIGKKGREMNHIKFRTMLPGKESGRIFFEQNRLNRTGRFIRRFHWDEIPEFFLILIGKMSFVGPRPLPGKLLEGLDTSLRHAIKPGYAGLAQIFLLKKGYLPKHLQIKLDNILVRRMSIRYYFKILIVSIISIFKYNRLNIDPTLTKDRIDFGKKLKNKS